MYGKIVIIVYTTYIIYIKNLIKEKYFAKWRENRKQNKKKLTEKFPHSHVLTKYI